MNKKSYKIPPTAHRVPLKTCAKINNMIRNQTIWTLNKYKNKSKEDISKRIKQLNCEWDTERVQEVSAASIILLSTLMGTKTSRTWFCITGMVGLFLMNHGLNGWCPSLPFVRKLGIRTPEEINVEKTVLKMIRGDFSKATTDVVEMYNMAVKK
jgi:hypothetical protein